MMNEARLHEKNARGFQLTVGVELTIGECSIFLGSRSAKIYSLVPGSRMLTICESV
jgi:hypothetical protein